MNIKSLALKLMLLSALCATAAVAHAQNTRTTAGGMTNVKLSTAFVEALTALDVTPGTVYPTEIEKRVASFPIIGGAIDLDTAAGNILHSGGLTLSAGGKVVTLESFIIDTTGKQPVITGLVLLNNKLLGRFPLFDLTLPNGISLPLMPNGSMLQLKGVAVALDPAAATTLNGVYSVSAFAGGFSIGTANVTLITSRCHNSE
ncbi:MAG: hypothetical protein P4L40_05535 [Terracidiphilus sp.]|nr:hypothetical protein [Terracidiphilus sp.]